MLKDTDEFEVMLRQCGNPEYDMQVVPLPNKADYCISYWKASSIYPRLAGTVAELFADMPMVVLNELSARPAPEQFQVSMSLVVGELVKIRKHDGQELRRMPVSELQTRQAFARGARDMRPLTGTGTVTFTVWI